MAFSCRHAPSLAPPAGGLLRTVALPRAPVRRRARAATALKQEPSTLLQSLKSEGERFFQKYDVLSCAAGACVCTGWFWTHGHNTGLEALSISITATVAALVVNEIFFSTDPPRE